MEADASLWRPLKVKAERKRRLTIMHKTNCYNNYFCNNNAVIALICSNRKRHIGCSSVGVLKTAALPLKLKGRSSTLMECKDCHISGPGAEL